MIYMTEHQFSRQIVLLCAEKKEDEKLFGLFAKITNSSHVGFGSVGKIGFYYPRFKVFDFRLNKLGQGFVVTENEIGFDIAKEELEILAKRFDDDVYYNQKELYPDYEKLIGKVGKITNKNHPFFGDIGKLFYDDKKKGIYRFVMNSWGTSSSVKAEDITFELSEDEKKENESWLFSIPRF